MIAIKNRYSGATIFESDAGSVKEVVQQAIQRSVSLAGANLYGASLAGANLYGASLDGASLDGASLDGASLVGASLVGANLYGASLYGANLDGANLAGASLVRASLVGASLDGANLYGAKLYGAIGSELAIARTRILPAGSLVGWKQCRDGVVVRMEIPAGAKRSHAFGRKCRAEYAVVREVIGADVGFSYHDPSFAYRAGETVQAARWDHQWQNECSDGIHFFITREEAEAYTY